MGGFNKGGFGGGGGGGGGAVSSVFTRVGAVVANSGDYSVGQVTGAAPLASPALTGVPTVPTAAPLTDNTQAASTAYVDTAIAAQVPLYTGQSLGATVSASPWIPVPAGAVIGLCILQPSPTGTAASGAALTVVLEQSATDTATTGTAIQSLTINSGSAVPVTGTPGGGLQNVPAGSFIRFNCTSAGGGIGWFYSAQY